MLWAEHNTPPNALRRTKVISSEIDDTIEALIKPNGAAVTINGDMD